MFRHSTLKPIAPSGLDSLYPLTWRLKVRKSTLVNCVLFNFSFTHLNLNKRTGLLLLLLLIRMPYSPVNFCEILEVIESRAASPTQHIMRCRKCYYRR